MRKSKENYYLDIAQMALSRGTCLRRNYGAIIVSNDEIIATGYTGAPRGRENCLDLNRCIRTELNIPRGERYEVCRSVHAEANAIISASREKMMGATIYLCGIDAVTKKIVENTNSCSMCKRLIINAGIKRVVIRDDEENFRVIDVFKEWIENDESLLGVFNY